MIDPPEPCHCNCSEAPIGSLRYAGVAVLPNEDLKTTAIERGNVTIKLLSIRSRTSPKSLWIRILGPRIIFFNYLLRYGPCPPRLRQRLPLPRPQPRHGPMQLANKCVFVSQCSYPV